MIEFDDGSGSVLRIQPLRTHRDEAIYECTATNAGGEINTSAKLTVLEGKRDLQRRPDDLLPVPNICFLTSAHTNVHRWRSLGLLII